MTTPIYLRPVGRVTRPPGRASAAPDKVLRLGGADDVVFAAFEMIERHADGWTGRRVVSLDEARQLAAQSGASGERIKILLSRLAEPRRPIAGMQLDRPLIMGIVNVTPDSFSDGGQHETAQSAIAHALRLEAEGADILDIGGESTRPGAPPVPLDDELRRVLPVIQGLVGKTRAKLSIDTRKALVMRAAAAAGVHIVNDVSALTHDPESLQVAAETKCAVVLMHAQGDPATMQQAPAYADALLDVFDHLEARVDACVKAGIPRERLIADPGIGFGKTAAHNLEIIAGLAIYHGLGVPFLLGASRKRFIGTLTGAENPQARLPGSIAAALSGVMHGAHILRVHDVAATRQALTIWQATAAGVAPV